MRAGAGVAAGAAVFLVLNAPLIKILKRSESAAAPDARLVLPFEVRSRSRFRACLEHGGEVGVMLARGQILRGGDRLLAEDGRIVEITAAPETVTTAHAQDAALLARGAYHLGNRHVPLQVGRMWLRYSHDHVLDDLLQRLGFQLAVEEQPFEPEGGAYHAHGGTPHDAHLGHDELRHPHDR